jgi:hypothetical protein
MRRICLVFLTCSLILGAASCGGGGSSTPTPPSALTLSPASATVGLAGTQQFSAMNGATAVTASWSVNGIQGGNSTFGTIDSTGKYTAPASFPSPNSFMVSASAAGATGNANLTVAFPNDNHLGQSSPIKLGTTGGNVKDSVTSGMTVTCCSGTLGSLILSNNHVLDKTDQGANGDPVGQPGLVDNKCSAGNTVATLSQAVPIKACNTTGCTGPAPNNVDVAIAQIVPGMVDTSGNILDLGPAGSASIAAAPPSITVAIPVNVLSANEGVAKSGRSTGLTCQRIHQRSLQCTLRRSR